MIDVSAFAGLVAVYAPIVLAKVQSSPTPPPPAPTIDDAATKRAADEAVAAQRELARRRKGKASTVLSQPTLGAKEGTVSLLGGGQVK